MSPKKLLMITNRYPAGPDDAASPFVHDFRKALENVGIAVDTVTPYYRPHSPNIAFIDSTIHRFDWSDGTRVISQLPLVNPANIFKIYRYFSNGYSTASRLIEENRPDGIIALWALPSGCIARKLARNYDIPYAVWALGSDINAYARKPVLKSLVKAVLGDADRVFADGYELAEKTSGLCNRECEFLPSMHKIDVNPENNQSREKQFVCVGRIERSKGILDLLEAFQIFLMEHPEWKLYYIGTGRAEHDLKAAITLTELDESVEYLGYCERDKINELLTSSAAAVIPSHSDSLPLTFGEAMQAKTPVVCSNVGDMPLFIDKFKVGLHYPAGDCAALAKSLKIMAEKHDQFRTKCKDVLEELDINNSARMIMRWLNWFEHDNSLTRKTDAYV